MKVLISEDIHKQDDAVEGIEFDIRSQGDRIFITIGNQYVMVTGESLKKILKIVD